jgi:hypothetical protein
MPWWSRVLAAAVAAVVAADPNLHAQPAREGASRAGDLDAFMREVLAKRDENWKKLQQYVLDERESIDLRGPAHSPIWGERREYTWFIREGFFVRSPVKVNGVTIGDADRQKYEADFLARQQRRERRRAESTGQTIEPPPEPDVQSLLRQTREPEFVSSAYFLRFRFEEGKYALVGREKLDTPAAGDVLRIEYYPTNLFRGTDRRRNDRGTNEEDRAYDAEFRRLMNKTALVTLWVEPSAHQIVKYTFDNIAFDFLPAQWLVHLDELHASMTMGQPFPDVWLPGNLDFQAALTLAIGQFDLRYGLEYHDYRQADVKTKVTVPKVK